MQLFCPTYYAQTAKNITPQLLKKLNIKALILDVDNTLTTHGNPVPDENIMRWLTVMHGAGIKMIILSNNTFARVKPFAARLGLEFEASGAKPLNKGFKRCCERLCLQKTEVAIVGDQLFTDIAGANLYGAKSLLVDPIEMESGILFIIKRLFERPFLKSAHKNKTIGV
ncbi:MAG: YqeG family HAD IIIA-type phosphatase [Hydrogenoanaerobacterium sp.]